MIMLCAETYSGNIATEDQQFFPQSNNEEDLEEQITPWELVGRQKEFQKVVQSLAKDEDLLVAGAPGNGRRALVKRAAQEINATVLDIDCMKATSGERLLQLICRSLNHAFFNNETAQVLIQNWVKLSGEDSLFVRADQDNKNKLQLTYKLKQETDRENKQKNLNQILERLIYLFQEIAEELDQRIVLLFQSFDHIRSWDRIPKSKDKPKNKQGPCEEVLRSEIQRQTKVSYVLVSKVSGSEKEEYLESILLAPLDDNVVAAWLQEYLIHNDQPTFNPLDTGLKEFLDAVQGHFGNARALANRLLLICSKENIGKSIGQKQVKKAIESLLKDMSPIFESLLLLLPDNQLQLLECLAIDPTENPHSKEYISKHSLMPGGTLQGALKSLKEKGLIYDENYGKNYINQLTLPLMAAWIRGKTQSFSYS
jgi:hypothetical protein